MCMEIRHLVTFRTIIEEGGFKRAADKLGYAQSSITAHMKELESGLGYPLFDRLGRNITLTQVGRRFLPYAEEIIRLYSESKDVIKEADEPSGQLIIGASESVMVHWLPDIIMDFMETYPKVELILKSIDYDHLTTQLKKGDIDIAILVETVNWNEEELSIQKVRNEKLSLIQSAKNQNNDKFDMMVFPEYSCSWRTIFEDYLKRERKTFFSKVELSSLEAIKKYVLCGLGTSMLPYFTIEKEITNGELKKLPSSIEDNSIAIYTALHKQKWHSINIEAFLSVLNK